MKMKKFAVVLLAVLLIAAEGLGACTIFAVGKDATVDGSTLTSHTCDSTGDDLRVWLIPSMEAGTERDIVLNGRNLADYSQFPAVKDYGQSAMVLGSLTYDEPTNKYVHGMYSFINDKGVSMGECTGWYGSAPNSDALDKYFDANTGILDLYCLQDLALEHCSTAREAVEYMGALVEEYGWNPSCETVNIADGNEAWIFEVYGGPLWVAVRVPDDMVFVGANRARVSQWEDNNPDYLSTPNIKQIAIDNGMWDGEGEFIPCKVFCPRSTSTYSTHREWIALTTLDPTLVIDENSDADTWPLFVKPDHKLSVDDIHKLSSNYYQGTKYDLSKSVWSGQYGNPLNPSDKRAINSWRCTYIQIANVKAYLPEEVRCLAYFGWGAPVTAYLTPIWASQNELPEWFGNGTRWEPYREDSGWWVASRVQQSVALNFQNAIEDLRAVRDPKMATQYKVTEAVQNAAAKMVKEGDVEGAVEMLTNYSCQQATMWHNLYLDLGDDLLSTYMWGNKDMGGVDNSEAWEAFYEKATK